MSIKKFKSGYTKTFGVLFLTGLMLCNSTQLHATDLNGIGVQNTQSQQVQQVQTENTQNTNDIVVDNSTPNVTDNSDSVSNAEAVGSLFENLGPKQQDFDKANKILRPFVEFINFAIAIGLGVLSALLLLITLIDLFYICVPIIRKWLDGGRSQQGGGSSGAMSGGMNMGGYGHGGMGMNMGGGQPSQAQAFCGQWVSDEAIVTYNECNPQQGGGMSGGMGMGMGMGMQQSQPTASKKVMLVTYAKKRVVFFFMFGLCLVLLFTTLFTELGINAGVWLLGKVSGLM